MSTVSHPFSYVVEHRSGKARAGTLRTAHGTVATPVFMPVATNAAVRGQDTGTLESLDFGVLLANTYHLLLRPGPDVFRQFGGIHRFMRWPRAVLTDSGGYQLFSLSSHLRMSEEGAQFRSYVDGKRINLTPETSIAMQGAIGSDIMMVLDHCISSTSDKATTREAMHLTHRWARRSFAARGDSEQALFGIVQGGCFHDLRRESASQITEIDFDGFAIGGVAVGEERSIRDDIIAYTADLLPPERPRYLMGVGTPLDILEAVASGMDMFDCIIPTAMAEQGVCFTSMGRLRLTRGVYAGLDVPLDPACSCTTCSRYSRAYLHHLVKAGEHLADTLIGVHNLSFYRSFMSEMRQHIVADTFASFYAERRNTLVISDPDYPVVAPRARSSKTPESLGDYEIHRGKAGVSIKQRSSGEVMHSVSDPLEEAEALYVQQSSFTERLRDATSAPLVVWDVGLGAATNAMAAIRAFESEAKRGGAIRPLRIVSFENDLDSLKLALSNRKSFPHLRHPAPSTVAIRGQWRSVHFDLEWRLLEGDFLETLDRAEVPELIFFDPFSYKTDAPLWSLEAFVHIHNRCAGSHVALFTYSASTAVRATLLAAGFFVAAGRGTGPKPETTIALTAEEARARHYPLLDGAWLQRWERSQSRHPSTLSDAELRSFEEAIRGHPQFGEEVRVAPAGKSRGV